MPVVSTAIDLNLGPILDVRIGFDPNFRPGVSPVLPQELLPALVDTGAGISSVDERLASALNLTIVDSVQQSGIGGTVLCDVRLAQIEVPSLQIVFYGNFATLPLMAEGLPYSAILGRDILRHFRMQYDGPANTLTIEYSPRS